jgi:mono/diheme cytochrome c family protein
LRPRRVNDIENCVTPDVAQKPRRIPVRVNRSVRVPAVAFLAMVAALGRVRAEEPAPGSTDYAKVTPIELAKQTPKGKIKDPYKDTQTDMVAQGETLFGTYSCSACHGTAGGGGMCPPVTNDIWVYGGDDDTLFRLVTLGSDQLQGAGYARVGQESIVAPMPPFGAIVKNADDLFKIIAFIRAHYDGGAANKYGRPAAP